MLFSFTFILFFEIGSQVTQAGLKLSMHKEDDRQPCVWMEYEQLCGAQKLTSYVLSLPVSFLNLILFLFGFSRPDFSA